MWVTNESLHAEVLIIGGGPSGSSAAYWLAMRGIDVSVIEKKTFPREKTCGDGLTPRSVKQLESMGMSDFLSTKHRYIGLRSVGFGKTMELPWPNHPDFPSYGYVVTRSDLDLAVASNSQGVGAKYLFGAEVSSVVLDDHGAIDHVVVSDKSDGSKFTASADYYIVADGANSRVGRALGAARRKGEPIGLAIRTYHSSPRHDDNYIESQLEVRDESGRVMPGYGWIFPLGDGRVNVGFGLLTNRSRWKSINTSNELNRYIAAAPGYWALSKDSELQPPTGGKLPMGHSIEPISGRNFLVIGDAAASINPFNGEGISYGYETGRIAADLLTRCIEEKDPTNIAEYSQIMQDRYGLYYKAGQHFVNLIANPKILSLTVWAGMHSAPLMATVLRIMANLLREDKKGAPELIYETAIKVASKIP